MIKKEDSEEIAEETNLHTIPNQIPDSVISDHHIKNSFINSPTRTMITSLIAPIMNFEKVKSAEKAGKSPIAKMSNMIESPISKSQNLFFAKEIVENNNMFPDIQIEGQKDKKAKSDIKLVEVLPKYLNPSGVQKSNSIQIQSKPKFIVDDYSFTPQMLLSFQKIPYMPRLTSEIISKNAIILKERPNVLSDKTLIIDLDDTLVTEHPVIGEKEFVTVDKSSIRKFYLSEDDFSITNQVKFVIRPFVLEFLEALHKIYEIVVYTASSSKRARKILDLIDVDHKFFHHIYTRENCFIYKNSIIKDIRLFTNRDIRKTIVIEDNIPCFFKCIRNGIFVPSYDGSKYDSYFQHILNFLIEIKNMEDVREYIHEKFHLEEYWERYKVLYQVRYQG